MLVAMTAPAAAEERWRFSADLDVDTLLQNGMAFSLGVTPAQLPRWRFALALRSHDLPAFQSGLSGSNDELYVTAPIAVEAVTGYRFDRGLVIGARAGVVHLHFARIGTFGIDEEFDYGVTPFVGYEWRPADRIYVQPWLGAMITVYRQAHGELPMQEADRTYSKWPTALRGGIVVGARY
ncbi:MAG: hypothetical protein M4D80_00620 [Myxococcota bacterium]|nr:hypothetical protein [Myxococcota bacterium]